MRYAFDDRGAAERRATQYFEMFCNRGIYHEGWTAVTRHSTPWVTAAMPAFDDDVWELYDTNTDWSQAHDLAAELPEKLAELQQLWLDVVRDRNVLPLDDRRIERFDAGMAGRPQLISGNSQILFGGMRRLSEGSVLNIKNSSWAITAEIESADDDPEGVVIAQGGAFGGWALYSLGGRPAYCYNLMGLRRFKVESDQRLASGTHQLRVEFDYDGGGLGKGGDLRLYLDGAEVGSGRLDATVPLIFSADETVDLGSDAGIAGERRLHLGPERVHRTGQLGADRPRRGRPQRRSPDLPRRAVPHRDGASVGLRPWWWVCRPHTPATSCSAPKRWT